jgi:caspase-like apoptosis-related cysteine protease
MVITSSLWFIIPSVAEEDHSDADCLLVTVLTHGESSKFLHAHDSLYNVEDLWLPFTADKCLSLAGKPKVFIIQVSEFIFVILIM